MRSGMFFKSPLLTKKTRFNSMPILNPIQYPLAEFIRKTDSLLEESKIQFSSTDLCKIKAGIFCGIRERLENQINHFNAEEPQDIKKVRESLIRFTDALHDIFRQYFSNPDFIRQLCMPRRKLEYSVKLITQLGPGFSLFFLPISPIGIIFSSIGLFFTFAKVYTGECFTDSARILLNLARSINDLRNQLYLEFENIALEPTHYEILNINDDASLSDIKAAYKKLALMHHPDKFSQANEEVIKLHHEMIQKINESYEILRDSEKRAAYDYKLKTFKNNLFKSKDEIKPLRISWH